MVVEVQVADHGVVEEAFAGGEALDAMAFPARPEGRAGFEQPVDQVGELAQPGTGFGPEL